MRNDELDLLSSIWIMASNDENHLITYEGIRYRLDLPPDFDVKSLVKKRPELFRHGTSQIVLDDWKSKMLLNARSAPVWIRAITDDQERLRKINARSSDDVFRSQFRAQRASDRSPIEIITWGLEHLDRLRKAKMEEREATAKSWQMWLVFVVGLLGIAVSIFLKFVGNTGTGP